MTHQDDWAARTLPSRARNRVDAICERFETACMTEEVPRIEDYLGELTGVERAALLHRLLILELDCRHHRGDSVMLDDYLTRFANEALIVREAFRVWTGARDRTVHTAQASTAECGSVEDESQQSIQIRCPLCQQAMEVSPESSFQQIHCNSCDHDFSLVDEAEETRDPAEVSSLGHFELIEQLGTGGYGTVWKARDTMLDRIVAVKVPRQGQLSPSESEKFLREARAAAQLQHPNIVGIHEIGRAGEMIYIVSDIVEGVSLSSWLSAKRPTVREAAQICAKIADALDHSHRAGVVHRDLKPQNILMDAAGEPHVTDFGLARREFGEVTMTIDGQVLGTPAYMSPEQASGKSHRADSRSDIYSLGVILFRLVTGELPFRGNIRMLIHQVLHEEPPSPRKLDSNVPRDLETICLKCLEKDAAKRYQQAQDVAQELRRFLRQEPIQARPIGAITRTWRWCKRNPSVAGLLAAVGCVLLAGTLVSSYFAKDAINARTHLADMSIKVARRFATGWRETEGYREPIWELISGMQSEGGTGHDELRRAAVAAMGDFVGLTPSEHDDFSSDITAMGTHPKGLFIAVGLKSGDIRLVEPRGKTLPQQLSRHDQEVIGLAFDEAGNELISVDAQGGIQYWEAGASRMWKPTETLKVELPSGGKESKIKVRFTPDRNYLLTSSEQAVVLRQLPTGKDIWNPKAIAELELAAAACSRDGRLLAAGYQTKDYKMRLVITDRTSPNAKVEFLLDHGYMPALTFSPNGRHLVCGCEQALVHYEVNPQEDDTFDFVQRPVIHTDAIRTLAFSSDSQFLASIDLRGVVTVRSVSNGHELAVVAHPPRGPQPQFLAFSENGTYLCATNLGSVKVWHFAGATERKVFSGQADSIPTVAYGPKGDLIVTGGKDNRVVVWNSATGEKLSELDLEGKVQCVAIDAKGKWLATAEWYGNKSIQVWGIEHGKIDTSQPIASIAHGLDFVNRLVFFSDSNRLAAAGDKGVMYWDIQPPLNEAEPPRVISHTIVNPVPAEMYVDVAISSDGKLLAYAADCRPDPTRIGVWDVEAAKSVSCNPPPMLQGWHGLAFIPDSHHLIFANSDGLAEIWDVDNNVSLGPLDDETTFDAPHLALSKSGQWFAGLVKPNSVGIWDTKSRQHLFDLRPERTAIWALAWSPDENRLVLGLSDGGLTVWDLQSINEQLTELDLNWQPVPTRPGQ